MTAADTKASAKLDNVGHSTIDAWQTADSIKAKQVTQGALKKQYWGEKATVNEQDYMFAESLKYSVQRTPYKVEKGLKPTLPVGGHHAYVQGEQIKVRAAIEEANRPKNLPAPKIGPDAYMVEHDQSVQRIVAYNMQMYDPDRPAPESPIRKFALEDMEA